MSPLETAILKLEEAHRHPSFATLAEAVRALRELCKAAAPCDRPRFERLTREVEGGRIRPIQVWAALAKAQRAAGGDAAETHPEDAAEPPPRGLAKELSARAQAHRKKAEELRAEAKALQDRGRLASPSILQEAARASGAAEAHEEFAGELRGLIAHCRSKKPADKTASGRSRAAEAGPVPVQHNPEEPT